MDRPADQQQRANARAVQRRALLRQLDICINGSLPVELAKIRQKKPRAEHGPPVPGQAGRCQRCVDIHAKSRGSGGGGSSRARPAMERQPQWMQP